MRADAATRYYKDPLRNLSRRVPLIVQRFPRTISLTGPLVNPVFDSRRDLLLAWLRSLPRELGLALETLRPASSDASFRRYFRIDASRRTCIVMDAPPAHEDCAAFMRIAQRLSDAGLNAPRILAGDPSQGLLLLSDLGPTTYYQRIQAGVTDAALQTLYRQALTALVRMQTVSITGLPRYDQARLNTELDLFPEWYAARHCGKPVTGQALASLRQIFTLLAAHAAAQTVVFVHRDFHSPNLMVCDSSEQGSNPGILDFQDALAGPICYDVASLVMDARTTWEEPQQLDWAIRYWEQARQAGLTVPDDFADFHRDYEWLGLQRNLRILGVFARLHHRDGKSGYLAHMPRVSAYVRQVAGRYRVFAPLAQLLDQLEDVPVANGYTF